MFEDDKGLVRELSSLEIDDHEVMQFLQRVVSANSKKLWQLAKVQEAKQMLDLWFLFTMVLLACYCV